MGGLLAGKTCLVTGAAGSLGAETARLFLHEGAKLLLVDRDAAGLERVGLALADPVVAWRAADVTRAADVEACCEEAVARFGPIDVIFSNAGTAGAIGPIADYPEGAFEATWRVHVKGAFLFCKYGSPRMADGGSIIITSSVVGLRGDAGPYGYVSAKHAQVGLMRAVAKELAPRGIRVNTIHPGPVDNAFQSDIEAELGKVLKVNGTDFLNSLIPLQRHARAAEIAQSVLYLASDMSSFVTGTTLVVDGGMLA
ncbi:MAG TPA: SDR family NAD(P)-dependent oxidoreductase [Rhodanobacteraceae bacterium]|nr:SDR family NAD(P)-dependent oxidoreductase [Rhodanobacteraceae bacterium]